MNYNSLVNIYEEYYQNQFPFDQIYKFFSYNNTVDPLLREWSFEALVQDNESFIKRFEVVNSAEKLKQLTNNTVDLKLKFDIGPIYSSSILDRYSKPIVPVQRELVFDIDSGDFDSVRKCCTGTNMCDKCWRFMECATCILTLFCQTFGFINYIFVFSGRRGLHCWIADSEARNLPQSIRLNMLKMFELIKVDNGTEIEMIVPDQFNVNLIVDICEKFFMVMCDEQNWLQNGDIEKFAEKANKWKGKKLFPIINAKNVGQLKLKLSSDAWRFLVVYFVYPRFDIEVTKSMNHLLKIPFSVHSKTLFVACPINPMPILQEYNVQLDCKKYENLKRRYVFSRPVKYSDDIKEYVAFFDEFLNEIK
ncbi:DNA primase small subunit [Spironucleus salmonicida]|uniref:DNA primase n=1 Tax=Spironucleus salmonicida TaxID=348837 RepID=V6LUL7_9EUKA|nr:DNA primase small subunit [Spironucleus salmonicida]|eukprot:EST48260.1 DNA primase [Spironucleus salmonicida]